MLREEIPMRDRIMDSLIHNGSEDWISGEKLSSELGISRAAICKHIMALREEGNIIESVSRRGYRLISKADPWTGTDIQNGLDTRIVGQSQWIWLKETDSTNQVAAKEALAGAKSGLVVVARRQNAGRGSKGHHWLHLPGSLSFSVLTRPICSFHQLDILPTLVLEACTRAIRKCYGLELQKVLPNDLFFNDHKVGGILIETMFHNSDLQWSILGIGLNVNVPEEAFPEEIMHIASSLYAETGSAYSISTILQHILIELEKVLPLS
jgi:BirA family biotin operon repressor/biotin-[acetyl-CoA-carboxylase] ligase